MLLNPPVKFSYISDELLSVWPFLTIAFSPVRIKGVAGVYFRSPVHPHTHAHPRRTQRKVGDTESDPVSALQEKELFWRWIWCLGHLASFTHILGFINLTLNNPQVFREENEKYSRKKKCCLLFKIMMIFIVTHRKSKTQS